MTLSVPFVLASASPRRHKLLERLDLSFAVHPSDISEEVPPSAAPDAAAMQLARDKARAVAPAHPEALTLAADTIVALDEEMLGKPAHAEEARAMLRQLSGRTHEVTTGLALLHPSTDRGVTVHETTRVHLDTLSEEEISAYVNTGSPLDKAGSYGIQDGYGALFVTGIEGDYYNVMGLPLHRLYRTLCSSFSDVVSLD